MIGEKRPDVVLASHPMPGAGCVELARSIKAAPNPPLVVVLIDERDAQFEGRLLPYLVERFRVRLRRVDAFSG
jgi:CheY-like chemotaxis protein